MLKKMLVVAAILAVAGTAFGGWNFKLGNDVAVPPKTILDDTGKEIPNPAYDTFNTANFGTDRTVDWEVDSGNSNLAQRKGEVWNWPASYDFVEIGKINVRMEIGFWIKLDCRDTNNLNLKQRTINTYGGQTTCKAYTNVATDWKVDYSDNDNGNKLGGKREAAISPNFLNASASSQTLTIKMKIWDVDLSGMTPSNSCLTIGTILIKVRPAVKANIYMSSCGDTGKYPVYSPPPATADVVWW
jgi:hypothetical protein